MCTCWAAFPASEQCKHKNGELIEKLFYDIQVLAYMLQVPASNYFYTMNTEGYILHEIHVMALTSPVL